MMVSKLARSNFKATQNQGLGNKSQDTLKSKLQPLLQILCCCKKTTGGFEYIASPINGAGEDESSLNCSAAKVIQIWQ